jgi:glyoxylase-like metal-dependent hydrolase (beta-lactamase superfamily II)
MRISRINHCLALSVLALLLLICQPGYSQESERNQPQAIEVSNGLYVLERSGCNITVSAGHDGVLVIDTGYQNQAEKNKVRIVAISEDPIRIIFNTHYHYDHVGGNEALSKNGAIIIAQKNSRKRMSEEWKAPEILGIKWPTIPPYPETFLSRVSFNKSITVHFNDDTVQAIHFPNAHSDSDAIIFFRKANVIHTGDLYLSNGFPIIDITQGGTVSGYIAAVERIIELCDEDTKLIPGHGPISDRMGLQAYRDMLMAAQDRIDELMKEGKTLEEVVAADPTVGLFRGGEKSWLPPKLFIYCVYQELLKL